LPLSYVSTREANVRARAARRLFVPSATRLLERGLDERVDGRSSRSQSRVSTRCPFETCSLDLDVPRWATTRPHSATSTICALPAGLVRRLTQPRRC
jgi:hypothetical protein